MSDPRLVIAIPTYERSDILEENLRRMAPALLRIGIPVFIFDDSRSDKTEQAVDRLRAEVGLDVTYQRNAPSLGHDANVLTALTTPQGEHVWLLGDSIFAEPEDIDEIHRRLHGQDLMFLNGREGATVPDETRLNTADLSLPAFLTKHTWHLTMTGATIYGARVISWWRGANRTTYANFPQLSVFLGFAASQGAAEAEWIGRRVIFGNVRKVSYWLDQPVRVFGIDWHAVIRGNVQAFSAGSMKTVLASHSVNSGVLGAKHLMTLRAAKKLTFGVVLTHWRVLNACSSVSSWLAALISLSPPQVFSYFLAKNLRQRMKADTAIQVAREAGRSSLPGHGQE